ncbi:MAG TPA: hypothetical protein VG276_19030 [Actinomycetes bacterium]|jgi:hypothetical protein|nr:hypothetical protein [Actinomycetes bacterium]
MLFSNLLVAIAVTTLWPLGLLGVLAACAWLERRTLIPEEIVPRRIRRMETKPPEEVEAMVLQETAHVVAAYWSSTGRPPPTGNAPEANGGRRSDELEAARPVPVQRAFPGRAARAAMRRKPTRGRHERR